MLIDELQEKLGYTFKDAGLLRNALRHTSYVYEKYGKNAHFRSNERLEFVGDAVVDLIVGAYLFEAFPEMTEGNMSKIRASVVCEETLARLAVSLGVPACLKLGVGELRTGGRTKPSILADAMESIVAAVFLDSDYATVRSVMLPFFEELIASESLNVITHDYKSRLQERLAASGEKATYRITGESGPDHMRLFEAEVTVSSNRDDDDGCSIGVSALNGERAVSARGTGSSKKEAEQAAAGKMLEILGKKI